jgi:DNA-binding CsgD family transcriptional regulator
MTYFAADAADGRLRVLRASSARLGGRLDRAWELSRSVLADPGCRQAGLAIGVRVLLDAGAVDRAGDEARRLAGAGPLSWDARGALAMAEGDFATAERAFLACGRELTRWGLANPALHFWQGQAALAAHAGGRAETAGRLARASHAAAVAWGAPRALGRAMLVSGVVAGDVELLADAVEVLEAPAELAEARYRLGALHAGLGAAGKARRQLETAVVLFRDLGNEDRARRLEAMLRRLRCPGEAALTGRESRVAHLAYAGCTNKEIATRLFLGLRTVEYDLTRVYGKLGVAGREELTDVLGEGLITSRRGR